MPLHAPAPKSAVGVLQSRLAWPACFPFAGHAIAGANGVLAWGSYHRALQQRQAELAGLEQERAQLRHRSQLLDPRKADPDMADELVRKDLGLVRPDEVIIPLD